jgi:hypothetical protein
VTGVQTCALPISTKAVNFLESMSAQSAIYGGWFMISELLKTFFKELGNVWGTLVQTLFYALFFGACRVRLPQSTILSI